jgi:spore germination cell wall hydrolase CwlJ-like protein
MADDEVEPTDGPCDGDQPDGDPAGSDPAETDPGSADNADATTGGRVPPPVDNIDEAIDIAARTIHGETRGEPDSARLAIADIIYNRVMAGSDRFGMTVEEVCSKPRQFSCWNPGDTGRAVLLDMSLHAPELAESVAVARDLVAGRVGNLTLGAVHHHHYRVAPGFARGRAPLARIGSHEFFDDGQ